MLNHVHIFRARRPCFYFVWCLIFWSSVFICFTGWKVDNRNGQRRIGCCVLRQKVAARMVRTVDTVTFHMESVCGDLGFFLMFSTLVPSNALGGP